MIIKKHFWWTLLAVLLSANNLQAKPEVIDWKVLSSDKFNASSIASVDLFIDKDNKVFIEVDGPEEYLWLNNNWVPTKQYGGCSNGFIKDGRMHLAFPRDESYIDIYTVDKDIVLENRITITDFPKYPGIEKVIYIPGSINAFYLLGSCWQFPRNPVEFMYDVLSGGHGLYFYKPVWAKIQGQTLLEYENIPYGGKIDESYRIKEVLTGKDTIHFFGFRTREQREKDVPGILHYAEYNVKKRKLVRAQDIYDNFIRYADTNDKPSRNLYLEVSLYWHVSADSFNDDLFVVFSWHGFRLSDNGNRGIPTMNIEKVNSPIYYSQSSGGAFGSAEVIGNGILPLVKTDSLGNVHTIWSNSNGDIVHKAKKGGKWGDEQIILNGVIDMDKVWEERHTYKMGLRKIIAEFDKDNNLNVVFTSKGKLAYAKIRFD